MEGIRNVPWFPTIPWMGELKRQSRDTANDAQVIQVAARALGALVASLSVNCIIMSFVAAPLGMVIISTALVGLVGELVCQLSAYAAQRMGWIPTCSNEKGLSAQTVSQSRFLSELSLVNVAGQAGATALVHESGHALAALSCYKGANPCIHIYPFRGGSTQLAPMRSLTFFGRLIGIEASTSLVIAGGIVAAMLVAMAALAGSNALRESHPTISRILELFAYVQLLDHILYGLMSLAERPGLSSNDFSRLHYHTGIHPLAMVATLIVLPAAQLLGYTTRGQILHISTAPKPRG